MRQNWKMGTGTLIGVSLGLVIGFAVGQPPLLIAMGLAAGGALDMWLNPHTSDEG